MIILLLVLFENSSWKRLYFASLNFKKFSLFLFIKSLNAMVICVKNRVLRELQIETQIRIQKVSLFVQIKRIHLTE